MKPQILLAAKVPPFLVEALAQRYIVHDMLAQPDPGFVDRVAPQVRAVVANGESTITADFLARLPAVELVSVFGVGYDGVDVQAARQRGIQVTNTPDVLTDDVADMAMALLLAVARKVPQADRYVRDGQWGRAAFPFTRKVSGARLGIVGLGRIGSAIAQRARGFGMHIAYTARSRKDGIDYPYYPTPRDLAEQVDMLIVSTVGGPATHGLIDAETLRALGPQGILVNIARGTVVDEDALVEALATKAIAGAGLDVFASEPRVPAALASMDNVVLTPHMASGTLETRTAMANLVLDNLDAHFAGRPLPTPVP
ncbi:2-hydroxyacid dehydrogenase [Noviherbaspirillum pedocola]|nr:2-hydroxyacid dehydrogenase [Noviherbaspirillum pedocola]